MKTVNFGLPAMIAETCDINPRNIAAHPTGGSAVFIGDELYTRADIVQVLRNHGIEATFQAPEDCE